MASREKAKPSPRTTPRATPSPRSTPQPGAKSGTGPTYTNNLVKSIQTYAAGPARRKAARIDPVSDKEYKTAQPAGAPGARPRRPKTPTFTPKEKAVLANLQEFTKEELDSLNQQLVDARAAKLEALSRANADRMALSMELQAVLKELTDVRLASKQQQQQANSDRSFVAGVLAKHKQLVERYKAQKIQVGAAGSGTEEMSKLESSVEELKFQLASAKALSKTLDELEQCNADTDKLAKLLQYHKIDLAIVKTSNRAALAKAKAHKDSLFRALVELEGQLVTAKEEREAMLNRQQQLVEEQSTLKEAVDATEAEVLKREIGWIKGQLATARAAKDQMGSKGETEGAVGSTDETGGGVEGQVSHLRSQINGIDTELKELKYRANKETADAAWDGSIGYEEGQQPSTDPHRARTAGVDGGDRQRYVKVATEDNLEQKMRELQQHVSKVENMTKEFGALQTGAEKLEGDNARLRQEKQALEEQLCSFEAELDARDRRLGVARSDKEQLEAELDEVETLLNAAGGDTGGGLNRASRDELVVAVEAANRAKDEMASQIAELQDELAAVRATATGDVGITEEELMEAVTAKEVAESERALVAEDLLHSQTRAVQLQKEMQTLQDEMQTVRQASVTAAATDRTALQRDNAALEEQLREAREEKKQLEEQLAKIKADVDKDSSMAASIRPPSGQPPPESKVRAVVEERTKAAGSEVPIVEDNDIIDLGQIWGMDFTWLGKFRWIPEKALVSALPVGWRQLADGERRPYYYELASGKSTYTHPNDAFFRDLFLKLRADLEAEQQRQAEVVQLHAEASSTIESLAAQREQLAAAEEELKRKEEDVARVRQEADNERKAKLGALEEERRRVRDEEVRRLAARVARGLQVQAKISTDGRPPLPPTATGKPGEDTVALKQEADAVNHQAMLEYAEYLGMDVTEDEHLLWIAEMALNAPVPDGWEELFDEQGHSFFHHAEKDVSQYEHPLDESFRQYYRKMKGVDGSDGAAGSSRPTSKK